MAAHFHIDHPMNKWSNTDEGMKAYKFFKQMAELINQHTPYSAVAIADPLCLVVAGIETNAQIPLYPNVTLAQDLHDQIVRAAEALGLSLTETKIRE